jgi:hypothetical protein
MVEVIKTMIVADEHEVERAGLFGAHSGPASFAKERYSLPAGPKVESVSSRTLANSARIVGPPMSDGGVERWHDVSRLLRRAVPKTDRLEEPTPAGHGSEPVPFGSPAKVYSNS